MFHLCDSIVELFFSIEIKQIHSTVVVHLFLKRKLARIYKYLRNIFTNLHKFSKYLQQKYLVVAIMKIVMFLAFLGMINTSKTLQCSYHGNTWNQIQTCPHPTFQRKHYNPRWTKLVPNIEKNFRSIFPERTFHWNWFRCQMNQKIYLF